MSWFVTPCLEPANRLQTWNLQVWQGGFKLRFSSLKKIYIYIKIAQFPGQIQHSQKEKGAELTEHLHCIDGKWLNYQVITITETEKKESSEQT